MQYVPAQTLSEVIRRDGPLSPQRTARVGLAVLGALRAAHASGIVHRDVKPSNVLLGLDDEASPDRVFLTDFGIASAPGDSSLTSSGLLIGSPGYIAPERARGDVPGPASDLWSLGATLFTAVEGHPPYDGDDPMATLTAVMVGEHAPYVRAGPLQPVLAGLLERDPAKRIMAAQLATALAEVATSAVSRVATVPSPLPAGAINPDASAGTVVLHVGEGSPISQAARPAAAEVAPPGQQLAGRTVAPPSRAAQSRAAQSRPTRSCRCTRPTPLAEVSAPPHMARVGQPLSRCRPWLGRLPDRPRRRWRAARWSRGRGSRRIDGFVRTVDGLVRPASVTRYCGDADRAAAPDDRRPH
jgi:serine/threonine protein kinase